MWRAARAANWCMSSMFICWAELKYFNFAWDRKTIIENFIWWRSRESLESSVTFCWQRDATWRKSIRMGSWWRLIFNITMMEEKAEKAQIAASINFLLQTIWSRERRALQILFFTINRFQRNRNGVRKRKNREILKKYLLFARLLESSRESFARRWQFQFEIFISTPTHPYLQTDLDGVNIRHEREHNGFNNIV